MSDESDIPSDDLIEEKLFDFLEGHEVEWFLVEQNRKVAFQWLLKVTALALIARPSEDED